MSFQDFFEMFFYIVSNYSLILYVCQHLYLGALKSPQKSATRIQNPGVQRGKAENYNYKVFSYISKDLEKLA